MNAYDKLIKARSQMLSVAPFWATLTLMLRLKEDPRCPTLYTDGKVLGFNPSYVEKLAMDELQGVCAHEAGHVVFDHCLRRKGRNPKGWNIAADYAINGIIREAFKLPKGALLDYQFDGMTAEEIYAKLPKSSTGEGGEGEDPGGCGEVRDFEGEGGRPATAEEIEEHRRSVRQTLTQAAQIAKGQGDLPAGIKKLLEGLGNPKLDWKDVLRRFINESVKTDYSWKRPSRRLISQGLYIPSLVTDDSISGIVVALDTSGSCWDEAIVRQFTTELNAIAGIVKGDVRVLYCDTEIQKDVVFQETDRPIAIDHVGGGGTDFCPVFELVEQAAQRPTCLVYLTDLEGRWPDTDPGYPVIWAVINGRSPEHPPFGEVIELEMEEEK